jgi:hypothetical protein
MGIKIKFSVQFSVEAPGTNFCGNLFLGLELKPLDGNELFVFVFVLALCK